VSSFQYTFLFIFLLFCGFVFLLFFSIDTDIIQYLIPFIPLVFFISIIGFKHKKDLITKMEDISISNIFLQSREMTFSKDLIKKALGFVSLVSISNSKFKNEIRLILSSNSFSNLFLREANLKNANLKRIDLSKSRLMGANLECSDMQSSYLRESILIGSNMREINLENADLFGANLENSNLWGANLENANLENANLNNIYMLGASLLNANIKNATFKQAIIKSTKINQKNLEYIKSQGAIVSDLLIID